jgi:hypothetical protein
VCLGAYSGHSREISPLTPSGYRAFVVTIHLSPLKRGSVQSKTRRATVQLDLLGYGESSNRHWVGSKVPIEASTHLYLFSSQRQAQAAILLLGVKGSRTSCMLMTGGAFQIFSFLREREREFAETTFVQEGMHTWQFGSKSTHPTYRAQNEG